jgi:sodium transport system ATP-binding protein
MIQIEHLKKTFPVPRQKKESPIQKLVQPRDKIHAVEDISFVCKPGRIFSLVGPNGAGKTTTLRIIATMLKPDSGNVTINGYDAIKKGKTIRRQIGFLTGTTGLYERLTPDEILSYFARLYNLDMQAFKKRRADLFQLLGIKGYRNKKIGELSSGMKQKVSICRTIIHDPDVIVLDEPTAGLDVITAKHIIELIKDYRQRNKTVLFSTHNMSEVELLADDIAIIHDGKLTFNDTMEQFKAQMSEKNITEEFIRQVNMQEEEPVVV